MKPKKLWDNYIEVASVQKGERLKFVLAAGTRDGYRCVNIREFYFAKKDGVWKPGRDGILIPLVAPSKKSKKPDPNNPPKMLQPMKEMLEALQQAIEVASTMALEDPENAMWLEPKEDKSNEN